MKKYVIVVVNLILIVRPEKKFEQKGTYCLQETMVEEVIEGNKDLTNKKIMLSRIGGIVVDFRLKNVVNIDTLFSVNLMKPGAQYLVFCVESSVSEMMPEPLYNIRQAQFSVLKLAGEDITAVSDYTKLENDQLYSPYGKYANVEYLNINQESCNMYTKIKEEILEQYQVRGN